MMLVAGTMGKHAVIAFTIIIARPTFISAITCDSSMVQLSLAKKTNGSATRRPERPDCKLDSWDNRHDDEWFATMDAFLFPDPSASQDVKSAARVQCLDGLHVFIVGQNVENHVVDQFDCLFQAGKGVVLREPGWIFPDANRTCAERRPEDVHIIRKLQSHALACKVPDALQAIGDSTLKVQLARRGEAHPFSGSIRARGLDRASRKHRLAVTHMFRDAGPEVSRWLDWHISIGVEHFYLYDNTPNALNGSRQKDQIEALFQPYEARGIVTRISWPYYCSGQKTNRLSQKVALHHALLKYGQVADWLISLDPDEFLVLPGAVDAAGHWMNPSVPDVLDSVRLDSLGVGVSWSHMGEHFCHAWSLNDARTEIVQLGGVPVSQTCPPKLTPKLYPGKYFIRTLEAFRLGFMHSSVHPPRPEDKSVLTSMRRGLLMDQTSIAIGHFRSKSGHAIDSYDWRWHWPSCQDEPSGFERQEERGSRNRVEDTSEAEDEEEHESEDGENVQQGKKEWCDSDKPGLAKKNHWLLDIFQNLKYGTGRQQ